MGTVALAYADAGDPNRALCHGALVRARTARPDTPACACMRRSAAQDPPGRGAGRHLAPAAGHAHVRAGSGAAEDIRVGYILRQADAARGR